MGSENRLLELSMVKTNMPHNVEYFGKRRCVLTQRVV